MGLRRRSIRLRIFLLVLIPLLSVIGLYVFVASITVGDAVSAARASSLKHDTGQPIGNYQAALYAERTVAVIYLAAPSPQTQAALTAQEAKTDQLTTVMRAAVTSSTTLSHASTEEKPTLQALLADAASLPGLRNRVLTRAIGKLDALNAYNSKVANAFTAEQQVDLIERSTFLLRNATALTQLGQAEDTLLQENALLLGDLAARSFSQADRHVFAELAGARRALQADGQTTLSPDESRFYHSNVSPATMATLTSLEDGVIADTRPSGPPPVQPAQWNSTVAAYSAGFGKAVNEMADSLVSNASGMSRSIYLRLWLAGGLGLLAVLVSVFISIWIGRGLVRQLSELRRSALTLAGERLPRVVERLRAGEDVDVTAEAPPLEAGPDEIGQVSQALNAVQRTAVEATVDQARLRRGVSDVFRNLARRSQSLLHRQLSLLDSMERRANDPDELADLYRLDHLTTRMRRHAEGLIILSGAAPGRSWRNPVRLVDVLRAAVAEIEDYTRVTVVTMTQAALAGPAVADVIHMIAELVENATLFSPPNTPVRLVGDIVGKGFAGEIEDRGLGLGEDKLADINNRLAHPPEFDLSDSDQLGLFVAARLASRHGIKISMRPNPYGGTTAIVLIPHELVVPEEVYALDSSVVQAAEGAVRPTGRHAARSEAIIAASGQTSLPTGTHPYAALPGPHGTPAGADMDSAAAVGAGSGPGVPGLDIGEPSINGAGSFAAGTAADGESPDGETPASTGSLADGKLAITGSAADATLLDPGPDGTGPGGTDDGRTTTQPAVSPSGMSWFERSRTGAWPARDGHDGAEQADTGAPTADLTELGLPRRIRQASLAPQLRNTGPRSRTAGGDDLTEFPSPEEARATMTAIQRGWERGRTAFAADADPEQADVAEPNGSAAEGGSDE